MKNFLRVSMGLILFAMSFANHAAGSMGILSLIPFSILSNQNQSLHSDNPFESSSLDIPLSPRLEQELQQNEFLKYFKLLDDYQNLIEKSQNSSRQLLQIDQQLQGYSVPLNQCILNSQSELSNLQHQIHLLKDIQSIHFLKNISEKNEYLYQLNRNNLSICHYLKFKIKGMRYQIQQHYNSIYFASFTKKYMNVWMIFKNISFQQLHGLPHGYVLHEVMIQSRLFTNLAILIFSLCLLFVLKLYRHSRYLRWLPKSEFSLKHYMHIVLVYILISPVLFLLLKTSFAHHDEILMKIFKHSSSLIVLFINFMYLYIFYNRRSWKLDLVIAVPSLFLEMWLIIFTMGLYYYNLHNISELQSLYIKYCMLVDLQLLLLCQFYWLMVRALEIKNIKCYLMAYLAVILLICIPGFYGYVDMAINVELTLILTMILMVWMILLTHFRKIIICMLSEPSDRIQKKLMNLLDTDYERVILHLIILANFIYFILLSQFIIICLVANLWFYSKGIVFQWYDLVYHKQTFGNFSFVLINYFYGIAAFLLLNILNYFASNYFAKKILQHQMSIHKTAQIFYWLGTMLILILCSFIAGFDLKSIFLLFGALLLGIGFGMKNILMDLFSGIIIYLNRPFEVGDLINIDQHKGYVHRIGLLETIIKNLDKDMIIFPNQFVATSVIENYTFKNKKVHAVHLVYVIDKFQDKDDAVLNDILYKILKHEKQVVKIKDEYFQCDISPDMNNLGSFQVELIIFLNDLKNIKTKSNQINIQILEALNENHMNARFIGMTHVLNNG